MNSRLANWITAYAGWAAIALLIIAIFSGLIATSIAFPLFLLVAACALAILHYWEALKTFDFWALDEWIRTRRDSIGVRDWHSPHHAAELFCSPVVVRARNEAAAEMNSVMMELIRDPNRSARAPAGGDPPTAANAITSANSPARSHTHYEAAQIRYNQCNAALSRELLAQLTRGDLLAKGLLMRNDVALAERIIPTSRWRVMSLDIAKANASGPGWSYTGIVVGKKPIMGKKAKPPNAKSSPANS